MASSLFDRVVEEGEDDEGQSYATPAPQRARYTTVSRSGGASARRRARSEELRWRSESARKEVESLRREVASRDRDCLLYTSPSPRDQRGSRMPSSA